MNTGANGWRIEYRIDAEESGLLSLEHYATNRIPNDRHVLLWADGYGQHLDAMSHGLTWNPRIPGEGGRRPSGQGTRPGPRRAPSGSRPLPE
jgi:hypothetical protein